jgi:hypothetical protein
MLDAKETKPTAGRTERRTQLGASAEIAGCSITRMVQLRELMQDGYCWESPVKG